MARKPKLTPNFADGQPEVAPVIPEPKPLEQVMTFPASRIVGTYQLSSAALSPAQVLLPALPAIPQAKPVRNKVAIIGTAPSSRMLAPFNNQEWDIWVCSPGNRGVCPRVDCWFEIHRNLHWPEHESYGKEYIKWLSEQSFPVYMQDQSYFPHALTFPMMDLVKEFGGNFFSSSFAWMMAFAIKKGHYKEIGLYGVDMASKEEYVQQRQGFYHWLELARSKGIIVTIPPESDLMQPPSLYGYSEVTDFGRKMHARKAELLGRIAQIEQQEIPRIKNQLEGELRKQIDTATYLKGAVEDLDYILSIWPRVGHKLGE